jgi:Chaperone of endosialidase
MFKFGTCKTAAAALFFLTSASAAVAQPPDPTPSDSSGNTAAGTNALLHVVTTGNYPGFDNTAIGASALKSNTAGLGNTASGAYALYSNTAGDNNSASGAYALGFNTTGSDNAASGAYALYSNTTGSDNTASGSDALHSNTGNYNTASGAGALDFNTTGSANTANGANALIFNTTGGFNTASGNSALYNNITGSNNTALGSAALYYSTAGSGNIAIGFKAGVNLQTGSNDIYIGNSGQNKESNTIRIGAAQTRAFIAGVRGVQTGLGNAVAVFIDGNGQLGTLNSSARFKEDIRDMAGYSRGILDLRPVTYHYREPAADGARPLEAGLIAEEVAKVYPDLVAYGRDGQLETVQYHKLTPMLLNEVQRQETTLNTQAEQLNAQAQQIADLKAQNVALRGALAELKTELQASLGALRGRTNGFRD